MRIGPTMPRTGRFQSGKQVGLSQAALSPDYVLACSQRALSGLDGRDAYRGAPQEYSVGWLDE